MLSFGDSTPFPLRTNFLDTLTAAVETCTSLFKAECLIEEADRVVHHAKNIASAELTRLDNLEQLLLGALTKNKGAEHLVTSKAATSIANSGHTLLLQARQDVTNQRDAAIRSALALGTKKKVTSILSRFWLTSELPHSQWSFRWRLNDNGMRAELRASAASLCANFVARPSTGLWSAPIAVASLVPDLNISIPMWTRRCKGTETKPESLMNYLITEIDSSRCRQRFVLRRPKAKHAVLINLGESNQPHPTISLIDEQYDVVGTPHQLAAHEVEALAKLWTLVHEHQDELISDRSELTSVSIDNRNVVTIERPAEIAEHILASMAPLVREIRMRSRVPGELILKRSVSRDRREELFLARESLHSKYSGLPERHQQVFDAMGLGNESTREFVTHLSERVHSSRPKSVRPKRVLSSTADAA